MSRFALIAVLLSACGDNEPACTIPTEYNGPVQWCQGLANQAVCVRDEQTGPVMCRELCAPHGSACSWPDNWNTTRIVDETGEGRFICYCEPNPQLHDDRETLDN